MTSPIQRNIFYAVSNPERELMVAMGFAVNGALTAAREELGEEANPISITHHVTVHGGSGETAPSFLSTVFKGTVINPPDTRYTVTVTGVFEVFRT